MPDGAQGVDCTFCEGHVGGVQVQLQSRAVRQAAGHRAPGTVSPRRSACGGCTSSGSGCAMRTARHPALQVTLATIFLVLGLLGGWVHWQRDRRSFWFFGPLMFTMTLLLIYYLNFKYGYSQAPELGDDVAARGARPRLLLPVELLGVERVGGARARVRVGDASPRSSDRKTLGSDARRCSCRRRAELARRVAGAGARARSAVRQLAVGVARGRYRRRATSRPTC